MRASSAPLDPEREQRAGAARSAARWRPHRGASAAKDGDTSPTVGCEARNAATRVAVAERRACAASAASNVARMACGAAPVEDAAAHGHQVHHAVRRSARRWWRCSPTCRDRCRRATWCRWRPRRRRLDRAAARVNAHGEAMVVSSTRRRPGARSRALTTTSRSRSKSWARTSGLVKVSANTNTRLRRDAPPPAPPRSPSSTMVTVATDARRPATPGSCGSCCRPAASARRGRPGAPSARRTTSAVACMPESHDQRARRRARAPSARAISAPVAVVP